MQRSCREYRSLEHPHRPRHASVRTMGRGVPDTKTRLPRAHGAAVTGNRLPDTAEETRHRPGRPGTASAL